MPYNILHFFSNDMFFYTITNTKKYPALTIQLFLYKNSCGYIDLSNKFNI